MRGWVTEDRPQPRPASAGLRPSQRTRRLSRQVRTPVLGDPLLRVPPPPVRGGDREASRILPPPFPPFLFLPH